MSFWKWTAAALLAVVSAAPSQAQWNRWARPYPPQQQRWAHHYPHWAQNQQWNNQYQYQPPPPPPQWNYTPQPPPAASQDGRWDWVYGAGPNAGSFQQQGNGMWVESNINGSYRYTEVARGPDYVELYDPDRGLNVRLYATYEIHKPASDPNWVQGYVGHWQQ